MSRHQDPSPPPPRFHGLDMLPVIGSLIDGQVADMGERYDTLTEARSKPHVLDDATLERVIRLHTEMLETADVFDEQLVRWQRETLTERQRAEIARLVLQMGRYRTGCEEMLALARELKPRTIDAVLGMSDEDAGLAELLRLMGGAVGEPPGPLPPFNLPAEVTLRPVAGPKGELGFEFRHATLGLLGYIFVSGGPSGGIDLNAMVADAAGTVDPELGRQRRAYFAPLADRLMGWLAKTLEHRAL